MGTRALPLFALTLLGLTAGAAPLLRNPQLVSGGRNPVSAYLTGDFNGDGHADMLVVGHASLNTILDDGTAPFAKPVVTSINSTPSSFGAAAAADVNGDGRTDVVEFDATSHSITVFFGNVDGTFTPGPITPASVDAAVIAAGDFNGDHKIDVVLATTDPALTSNTLTTYLGNGSGNFTSGSTTVAGYPVSWMAPADLNGDGKTDMILVSPQATSIWMSKGDGTFTAGARFASSNVACGDFNHDGKIDLALAADHNVDIYLGNGDGTATKSGTYIVGSVGSTTKDAIKGGDVDGDGNLDLVVASTFDGTISVIRGKADGTFQQPTRDFIGDYATPQVFLSDYDRDGKLDLLMSVSSGYSAFPMFSFAHGNGDGTFGLNSAAVTFNSYAAPHDGNAVIADVNRDGKPDIVVIERNPDAPSTGYRLAVLLNDGTGTFAAPISTNTGTQSWDQSPHLTMADVNGDGIVDAVILSNPQGVPTAESMLGNGDGTFGAPVSFSTPAMGYPHLADFDGDGVPDLLVSAGFRYVFQRGNGNGTFAAGVITDLGLNIDQKFLLADLNGDGKMDFVATHSDHAFYTSMFLNDGKGNFTESYVNGPSLALAVSDFNKDGKPDILSRGPYGIQVRLGNGNGTFGAPIETLVYFSSDGIESTVAADFNGDGNIDFAVETSIYLGRGDGTFSSGSRARASFFISDPMTADLDGNGTSDLVFTTWGGQLGIVLTNIGSDPTTPSSIALTANNSTLTATVTGAATPLSGMVAFAADGKPFAIVPLTDGKVSVGKPLPLGSSSYTATYAGDEYYRTSTTYLNASVPKAGTTIDLLPDANPQSYGRAINVYGYLWTPSTSSSPPTGLIVVHEGSVVLGTIRPAGSVLTISGGTLSVGSHVITADYAGDANFESSSTTYTQVISDSSGRRRAVRY